jgi:NAD(P)-dependent dehydrogenase (short-subunit alcohol dehydrogenase family)
MKRQIFQQIAHLSSKYNSKAAPAIVCCTGLAVATACASSSSSQHQQESSWTLSHRLDWNTWGFPSPTTTTKCASAVKEDDPLSSQPALRMSREPRLFSKVAVVTGASSGLGQAIAIKFVQEGAKVVLIDVQNNADETLAAIQRIVGVEHNIKAVATFAQADISNPDDVQRAIQKAVQAFGPRIDVLVNNACRFVFASIENASVQEWEESMRVNIMGHALVTKACIPYMKHAATTSGAGEVGYGPTIVFQGSISSFRAQPNCATYATTKGAIVQLARNAAYDLAKYNIRVNSLCAGTIETPISQREREAHNWTFEEWQTLKTEDVILQRVGTPVEIAKAAVFLASDESSYCTGAHLMVDGGAAACTVMQRW